MKNEMMPYKVIGLMSGTSLDGLDIAYCHFSHQLSGWSFELIQSKSISYSADWKAKLKDAFHLQAEALLELNVDYGKFLALQVKRFMSEHTLDVDFVASHGHTVFHQPEKGFTYQIGSGQEIALGTGLKVICDFRKKDIAFGGQGAPLVPIGDRVLYGNYSACLNLGGIANISFDEDNRRVAFDIGMANMLLNYLANKIDQSYDKSGVIAGEGTIDLSLLNKLNALAYFDKPFPKSLGYEWFLSDVVPIIERNTSSIKDKMTTAVEHEAIQIGKVLESKIRGSGEVLVTGGGAFNDFLVERIKFYSPSHLTISIPDSSTIDFKEAIIFAFMGVLKERGEVNCLKTVTGASQNVSGGEIFLPS